MLARELEERMKLIAANTRCRIFGVSYNPRYYYPYRLARCREGWQALRDSCYELMVDNGYKNESIDNLEVISNAKQLNADYVFPKDYPGDADRTLASLKEFLEIYKTQDELTAKPIPILQPPYADHYRDNEEFYDQFSHFAVGGLQAYSPAEQVSIIKDVREAVGDHTYLHGFGVGTSLTLIRAMRRYSPFLDSLDVSTAEIAVRNGSIPDKTLSQHTFQTPYGDDSTTVRSQFAIAVLMMLNYILSDKVNSETLEDAYYEETGLADVHDLVESTTVRSRHDVNFELSEQVPERQGTLSSFV